MTSGWPGLERFRETPVRARVAPPLTTNGFFDCFEEIGRVVFALTRMNDQMDMIVHKNIGPKGIFRFLAGPHDGLGQPGARSLFR